jgi:hypothetical protein
MSHSSNNYSASTGLKYVNKRCCCGQKAIVKISESANNKISCTMLVLMDVVGGLDGVCQSMSNMCRHQWVNHLTLSY